LQANLFNPDTGIVVDITSPNAGETSPAPSSLKRATAKQKKGLATVGFEEDEDILQVGTSGNNNNKYIANRMIEHLLSEDLDSEKNVLKLLSESIAHLVQPSHLKREADSSLRKLCEELIDQIKENFEACNSFSNEYDNDEINDDVYKKNILSFRCNLQRLAALYEEMNLIEHIGEEIFDQINIAVNAWKVYNLVNKSLMPGRII
jgi:hypothetical protein